jgi:hypothetical protein
MSRNFGAHQATPQQLAGSVTLLTNDELAFYSALFKLVFGYQHTEVNQMMLLRQILTNSESRRPMV